MRVLRTLARPPAVRAARVPYNASSDRSVPLMAMLSGERPTHVDTSPLHHSTPPLDLWQQNAGARSLATRRARHALAPPVGRCNGWVPQLSPSPSSSPPPPHSSRTLTLILTLTSLTSTVKVNLILRGHYYIYYYYYYYYYYSSNRNAAAAEKEEEKDTQQAQLPSYMIVFYNTEKT